MTQKNKELDALKQEIGLLMLGTNVFGWTADEATSHRIIDRFIDAGLRSLDTANMYSAWVEGHQGGESEQVIGSWVRKGGQRDKLFIATKVGMEMGDGSQGLSRKNIVQAVEQSLLRMSIDHIDLYQSHADDPDVPQEETLQAYADLIQQGKVRLIGASNFTAGRLMEAKQISLEHGLPTYRTLQPEYNLYDREDYETNLEALCLEQGLGVIPYYSLASGFLTGKYRSEEDLSKSVRGAGIKEKYFNSRGFKILAALDEVAARHSVAPSVIALAWLMHRPSITAPIASATSIAQLEEILQAVSVRLSDEEVQLLTDC